MRGKKLGPASDERKAKISAANKGRRHSAHSLAKMSAAQKGKKRSPEVIAKIIISSTGRRWTAEQRSNLSRVKLGCTVSAETRKKISESLRGKDYLSAESRARVAAANRGKVITGEHKVRIAEAFRKLTNEQISEIRGLLKFPHFHGKYADMARVFKVSLGAIQGIKTGRTWKHIP